MFARSAVLGLSDIDFDVDAYLRMGGHLADLSLDIPDEKLRAIEDEAVSGQISDEARDRMARVARFLMGLSQFGGKDAIPGDRVTEEAVLQGIWLATAQQDQ